MGGGEDGTQGFIQSWILPLSPTLSLDSRLSLRVVFRKTGISLSDKETDRPMVENGERSKVVRLAELCPAGLPRDRREDCRVACFQNSTAGKLTFLCLSTQSE